MPKKTTKTNWREHTYDGLHCLRQELGDGKHTDVKAFTPALRLRLAIGASRTCPNRECSRNDICAKPILECTHRPLADSYDWDYGWGGCTRSELYEVNKDSWQLPKANAEVVETGNKENANSRRFTKAPLAGKASNDYSAR
jgi:hypothetical protein